MGVMKPGAGAPIPKASLHPGMVPAEELPGLWRRSIAPYFDSEPVAKATEARSLPAIDGYHLDKAIFIDSVFAGQIFTRDRHWMNRYDDSDHLALQLFVTGENQVANGKHGYVERFGNIYAVNLAQTVKAQSTDAHVLSLILPRSLVMDELPHLADRAGAVFAPDSAGARLFVDYMQSLATTLPAAAATESAAILTSAVGLLDSLTQHDDATSAPALDAAFRAACRYIDRHLGDPGLDVERICRHLNCSRATLFRLFQRQGGVRQHIQRRRLVACFKAIGAAKNRRRPIFDIAFDYGFTSPSHFSHLFRLHFGLSPRDAREMGLGIGHRAAPAAEAGGSGSDDAERMWRWAQSLARSAA